MDIFSNFFSNLANANWWTMWGFLLVAFLLGLLLGYLIWATKLAALKIEHGKLQTAFDELQAKYNALLEKYNTLEGHYKRSQEDLLAANNKVRTLENEKGQLYGDLMLAKTDLEKSTNLLDAIKADKANVDDALKACLEGKGGDGDALADAQAEIVKLKAALAAAVAAGAGAAGGSDGAQGAGYQMKFQALEGIGKAKEGILHDAGINSFADLVNAGPDKIAGLFDHTTYKPKPEEVGEWIKQAKMADAGKWGDLHDYQLGLGGGNKAKIDDFAHEFGIVILHKQEHHSTPAPTPMPLPAVSADPGKPLTKEQKAAKQAAAADKLKATMGSKIPKATADQKDDLKLISGVGPFIEKKLNALGIYTFEQVSKFDADLVDTTTDAIQFFPGRIQRDDWVGQAAKLHQQKMSDPGGLTKKRPSNPEDLKVVEGIGPKIEQLLKNGGIPNWAALAVTPIDRLKAILKEAGDRYKMHNPTSWPEQAALADKGQWDELDKLQDYLIGGRDIG